MNLFEFENLEIIKMFKKTFIILLLIIILLTLQILILKYKLELQFYKIFFQVKFCMKKNLIDQFIQLL